MKMNINVGEIPWAYPGILLRSNQSNDKSRRKFFFRRSLRVKVWISITCMTVNVKALRASIDIVVSVSVHSKDPNKGNYGADKIGETFFFKKDTIYIRKSGR